MRKELQELLIDRKNELHEELQAIDTLLEFHGEPEKPEAKKESFAARVTRQNTANERRGEERKEITTDRLENRRLQFERIKKRIEAGEKTLAACKAEGTSDANYYNWKKKFAENKTNGKTLSDKDIAKISEIV